MGDILGYGDYRGEQYGFLLTPLPATTFYAAPFSAAPAPEASTWAMLVFGFMGLGYAARRRSETEHKMN